MAAQIATATGRDKRCGGEIGAEAEVTSEGSEKIDEICTYHCMKRSKNSIRLMMSIKDMLLRPPFDRSHCHSAYKNHRVDDYEKWPGHTSEGLLVNYIDKQVQNST